jgi:hypothetical protein
VIELSRVPKKSALQDLRIGPLRNSLVRLPRSLYVRSAERLKTHADLITRVFTITSSACIVRRLRFELPLLQTLDHVFAGANRKRHD